MLALRGVDVPGVDDKAAWALDLEEAGGWTAFEGAQPIAVGGIAMRWAGVGMAWSVMTRDWRRHARAITHRVQYEIDHTPLRRIEASVRCEFAAGHRWVRRLGFELEAPVMRGWGAEGDDYALYARVR